MTIAVDLGRKATKTNKINVGPSLVCQQIQWRLAGGSMSSR